MTDHASLRSRRTLAILGATIALIGVVAFVGAALASPGRTTTSQHLRLRPALPPTGWTSLPLPGDMATLSYPPSLHPVAGDADAVSVARLSSGGVYEAYLNATPRQGSESLGNWASFRLRLLRSDDAASAREIAAAQDVTFRGGTGSCVMDAYVSRIGHHSYQEIACLVQGRTSASVIVAAAPAAQWTREQPLLLRAVAAYQVR